VRVVTAKRFSWAVICIGLLAGCGGGDAEPAATTASQPADSAVSPDTQADAGTTAQAQGETELVREIFSYRGASRDPFLSLLESGDVRPLVQDLRITSITYDPRYPAASIAVLRDTIVNQSYSVRVGDVVGRIRIAEITPGEIVLVLSEFGSERQVVLRQRRRQEGTP
jgi:hypothetical protein